MSNEFESPSADEIAQGLINRPGGSIEGLNSLTDVLSDGIENGVIRTEISCEEARVEWLTTARRMYVENSSGPRFPIDAEVGIHTGACNTDECRKLVQTYWQVLRPNVLSGVEIAEVLDRLQEEIQSSEDTE